MDGLLEGLNDQQRQAVTAGEGPVLVLAGPGSGKTRVLTHRIAYLIGAMGVGRREIMAVTFTNKAAGEMRERVERLVGNSIRGMQIGTFHSICARMLRREGEHTPYGSEYTIYDTDDQLAVVKQALAELGYDTKKYNPRQMLGAISAAKNELVKPARFQALDYRSEIAKRVYESYQNILLDNNAMDFDDLLMQAYQLLNDSDHVKLKYQSEIGFLLVDEFQDTNMAQYELVKLLGEPRRNVFVVGDEDQGIYAFRGADHRNVIRFREDYPDSQVVLLEQNYRSTQVVLDAARAVIDRNTHRTPKALFTDKLGGTPVTVHEAYNETLEAQWTAEQIDRLARTEKRSYADFAVMYRTNAQSRALEEVFIREGIPYRLVGGVGFYRRREVRDMLAYLRVINSLTDKVSFARIINAPRRGIGEKSLRSFQEWAASTCDNNYEDALNRLLQGESHPLSAAAARRFAAFAEQLQRWREVAQSGNLTGTMDAVMRDTGYTAYLREISESDEQVIDRSENLQELRGLLAEADQESVPLAEFLTEQSLVSEVDALGEDVDAVTLLTLHAAKGLEYPVVFITGLEEGTLPHMRAFDEDDGMAEERRLMYVGLTRAEERLYLTYAFRRTMYGSSEAKAPSRFLGDLPEDVLDSLPPSLKSEGDKRSYQEQTRWEPSHTYGSGNRQQRDNAASGRADLRDKIVPFPGGKGKQKAADAPEPSFKPNDRVSHAKYGVGQVIESRHEGGLEMVTVVFDQQKIIKEIEASYLQRA